MKLIKVLHYLPDIDRSSGGVLTYLQVLINSLKDGIEVHVVTCHTSEEMHVEDCYMHYLSVRKVPSWNTKHEFLSILNNVHPDVFHTNACWIPTSALTAIWAKEAGYKVIYTPHGMMEPWILNRHYWLKKLPALLLYQKRALGCADIIHATSNSEAKNLMVLGYGNRFSIIPNSVDLTSIDIKRTWKKRKKILYFGRIHEKKGIIHLLEAVRDMRDDTSLMEYTVEIVGDKDVETPKYRQFLIEETSRMQLSDIVTFHNGVYDEQKWNLLRESDVLILPTYSENFGIVVAESLSVGTPVITTKGAPWSSLNTHNCGWWIEIGTEPLKSAIADFLVKNENDLELMGINGRRLVETCFGEKVIGQEYRNMYMSVIS